VEGFLCGISSGAAAWAALQIVGSPESAGKRIVPIVASTAECYISTELFKS
jgi:cysteine synthase A